MNCNILPPLWRVFQQGRITVWGAWVQTPLGSIFFLSVYFIFHLTLFMYLSIHILSKVFNFNYIAFIGINWQQYRAWSDFMDVQADLSLYWWQRLITFGSSRIMVITVIMYIFRFCQLRLLQEWVWPLVLLLVEYSSVWRR